MYNKLPCTTWNLRGAAVTTTNDLVAPLSVYNAQEKTAKAGNFVEL